MTRGWYAIPPRRSPHGPQPSEPLPYCRDCVQDYTLERVAPITDDMPAKITCRGCKRRLREWR